MGDGALSTNRIALAKMRAEVMSRPLRSALEPSQTFDLHKRQVFRGQNQRYRLRQHDPRPDRHSRGRRSRLLLDAGWWHSSRHRHPRRSVWERRRNAGPRAAGEYGVASVITILEKEVSTVWSSWGSSARIESSRRTTGQRQSRLGKRVPEPLSVNTGTVVPEATHV